MPPPEHSEQSILVRFPVAAVRTTARLLNRTGFTILGVLLAAFWLWTLTAMAVYEPWPKVARAPLVACWLIAIPFLWFTLRRRIQPREFAWIPLTLLVVAGALFVRVLWMFWSPSNDRDWNPGMERLPLAEFRGDSVTIHNVRDFTYRSATDFDEHWETRTYDLHQIQTAEMCIVPFSWDRRLLAHTFLTFGFADGRYVSISVEARRDKGEPYKTLMSAFRQHELMYIVADERDTIGDRVWIRDAPVYLYPMNIEPALVHALFVTMLTRANRLVTHPEWYNVIFNSCATNMIGHLRDVYQAKKWFSPQALVPGYLDRVAADADLLRLDGPIDQVRSHYLINEGDVALRPGSNWSLQIRGLGQPAAGIDTATASSPEA